MVIYQIDIKNTYPMVRAWTQNKIKRKVSNNSSEEEQMEG